MLRKVHAIGGPQLTTIGNLFIVALSPQYRIYIQSSPYQGRKLDPVCHIQAFPTLVVTHCWSPRSSIFFLNTSFLPARHKLLHMWYLFKPLQNYTGPPVVRETYAISAQVEPISSVICNHIGYSFTFLTYFLLVLFHLWYPNQAFYHGFLWLK